MSRRRGPALVDEVFDLTQWLGVAADDAVGTIGAAAQSTAARRWDGPRRLEVLLLGTAASIALGRRSPVGIRNPPRLSPRALHPSATVLAPARSVDAFARTAREVLALLPADLAALALLSVRYEVDADEAATLLSISRRRAGDLLDEAHGGFAGTAGAALLWNGGQPECAGLRELVVLTGIDTLGQSGARLLLDHAERCRTCNAGLWQVTEVRSALASAPSAKAPADVAALLAGPLGSLTSRPVPDVRA